MFLRLSWLRCTQMHESHDKRNTAHVRFVVMIVRNTVQKNCVARKSLESSGRSACTLSFPGDAEREREREKTAQLENTLTMHCTINS